MIYFVNGMGGLKMKNDLEPIKVSELFRDYQYLIPIYQRNFAWTEVEIEQLIEDIESVEGNYYLGNLIVNHRLNDEIYEVIDGQQRLTTLYLLGNYLGESISASALQFEAREKSNRTLRHIHSQDIDEMNLEGLTPEIIEGYGIIKSYFEGKGICSDEFSKKLEKVSLVQVKLPEEIDLNHYFEIMNTRGEQLELHEIVKSKLLEALETNSEREVAALIWESCSNMDSYVQMNFNSEMRKRLFTEDWGNLIPSIQAKNGNFTNIQDKILQDDEGTDFEIINKLSLNKLSLIDILESNETIDEKIEEEDKDSRFESIITFPNFLLQVNSVIQGLKEDTADLEENESNLDDKNFLKKLSWASKTAENARKYLYFLLKCRVIFDQIIVKRENLSGSKQETIWSLKQIKNYTESKKQSHDYINSTNSRIKDHQLLLTLQASLRITYTSPKTMHWITLVLQSLLDDKEVDLVAILEDYSMKKLDESKFEKYEGNHSFSFDRIVFTYLDYLLYRDGYPSKEFSKEDYIISPRYKDYKIQFRSSIEHLYPQTPINKPKWESKHLHSFGNLALLSVSDNSGFSNLPPESKIHKNKAINQTSLKLKIMETLTNEEDGWTKDKVINHKDEMFRILKSNGGK